jgi:RNA polymerase sigma factor (sigma-70 family)
MTDCVLVRRRAFRSKNSEPAAAGVTLLSNADSREADGLIRKEPGAGPQHIKTLFVLGAVGGLTDGELLTVYSARGGETAEMAFSALVERHGPMVLRVCRSILRDEPDAEDAFQATFVILFRNAGAIRKRESVASWLHGVALRVAGCSRASAARRRVYERRSALASQTGPAAGVEPDLRPLLHEELDRLPERYRVPVVLCYLEGVPCEEAAQRLGWPVGTVKSRLARGRARLRSRLIRRGLAPSAVLVESAISGETASAAISSRAVELAVRTAIQSAKSAPGAGVVPVAVAYLTQGALKAMIWGRWKTFCEGALAAVAVMVVLGGAAHIASGRGSAQPTPAASARRAVGSDTSVEARAAERTSPERLLIRSRELIDGLPADSVKARLLSELATVQAELGFRKEARETGRRAVEIAETIAIDSSPRIEEQTRVNELREAARALARAGDVDAALDAEEKIGEKSPVARSDRQFVLQEVGQALVQAGSWDGVRRVRGIMEHKGLDTTIVAWCLATAQAEAGDVKAAFETADSITDQFWRVGAMVGMSWETSTYFDEFKGGIALAQFQSGDRVGVAETLRKAQAVAAKIADAKAKSQSLSVIARAMLKMGDLPGAVQTTESVMDNEARDRALVDIATVYANARHWDDAMKAVESVRGDVSRFVVLNRVGVARGKAQDASAAQQLFSRALEIGKGLKLNGQPDPTAAYCVALAQAETGDYRAARQTLRRYDPDIVADEIADVIAGTQARAGDFTRALLTLQSLPPQSRDGHSAILGEIARLRTESGDETNPLDSVDELGSAVTGARVLMGSARGLAARLEERAKAATNRVP